MTWNTLRKLSITCLVSLVSLQTFASELDYPELLVTPRATDRLATEAPKEHDRRWFQWIPFQASALATVSAAASFRAKDPDNDDYVGKIGLAVGTGWVAGTVAAAMLWHPYQAGLQEISQMPSKSQRDQLTRERVAEETFASASSMSKKLAWLSTLTNAGASFLMFSKTRKDSSAFGFAAAGIGLSILPLLFEDRYQRVWREQRDYKKRIYAPIASVDLLPDATASGRVAPALTLALRF